MTQEIYTDRNASQLLKQLVHILESDTLIDEVGFIHPSQFAALDNVNVGSNNPPIGSLPQSVDEVVGTNLLEATVMPHDSTIFWNRDHKLAISTEALFPLYNAAKHAFMTSLEQYKLLTSIPKEADLLRDERATASISVSEDFLETEVMRHSKALLLLSCDYGTAWNSRKLVTSKKQQLSLFMDELLFSALILSYSPKSEHTWSHRRWVIKTIYGKYPDIVEKESELVAKIAEKWKMNYRAWNHRCWLITYMTREQVLNELNKSRKWAELHVGDSSCFHYRQHLLSKMFEENCSRPDFCLSCTPSVYDVWKEELVWNEMLINLYIGREALWVHRRFLYQFGVKHVCTAVECAREQNHTEFDADNFIKSELQLAHTCLNINDEFEDDQAQRAFAASYILWVSKVLVEGVLFTVCANASATELASRRTQEIDKWANCCLRCWICNSTWVSSIPESVLSALMKSIAHFESLSTDTI